MNNDCLSPEDFTRYWNNLGEQGKLQAFKILTQYPENRKGEAKDFMIEQIKDFKKFFSMPDEKN